MKFAVNGFDRSGKPFHEIVEASSAQAATEQIQRRGLFACAVAPAQPGSSLQTGRQRPSQRAGARLQSVAGFFRQLAVLVGSGTPMIDALASIERQSATDAFGHVVTSLRERVEEGVQLSDAMALHPVYFDGVCRSLVSAGESGGKMDEMLLRLSELIRAQVKMHKTLVNAMVYPSLLICVSVAVLFAMLGFVLPRFERLFAALHTPLPPTTQALMTLSGLLREFWYVPLSLGLIAAVGGRLYFSTDAGATAMSGFMLTLPKIGKLTRDLNTSRLFRVLGVLISGRVPIVDALRLVKHVAETPQYQQLMRRAEETVMRGETLSQAFDQPKLINPGACDAMRSAERAGRLGTVLLHVADALDEENEMLLKTLTGLLEPVILIGLGLMVGTLAISMFLPLFDLTASGAGAAP